MGIKDFIARQVTRAGYLVERVLVETEKAADDGGVLPKLPPNLKAREEGRKDRS